MSNHQVQISVLIHESDLLIFLPLLLIKLSFFSQYLLWNHMISVKYNFHLTQLNYDKLMIEEVLQAPSLEMKKKETSRV